MADLRDEREEFHGPEPGVLPAERPVDREVRDQPPEPAGVAKLVGEVQAVDGLEVSLDGLVVGV